MKKRQNWIIAGFLALLLVAGYFIVAKPDVGGFIDLSSILGENTETTNENGTISASVSVSDVQAKVLETGETLITFNVIASNANISGVTLYYALNVADPSNATYTSLEPTLNNGTYEATVPTTFGDSLYYYIEVSYLDGNETKTYKTETFYLQVKDTYAPTIYSVSIDYNGTLQQFAITFNATDNDMISEYTVYYASNSVNDFSNVTFTSVSSATLPITINATEGYYYAFYFEVEDLSGNVAVLFNETEPLVLQANSTSTWPVVVNG